MAEVRVVSLDDAFVIRKHVNEGLRPVHHKLGRGTGCHERRCEAFKLAHRESINERERSGLLTIYRVLYFK